MDPQLEILDQTFEDWKGNSDQADDVLVIGIKLYEGTGYSFRKLL